MKQPLAWTKLIDMLARLFDDEETSRMIVTRAGIDGGLIEFTTASLVNWTKIVNEAINQKALRALVETAAEQRKDVPELMQLLADYEKWAASSPEATRQLVSQKAPGFLERARLAIVAWFMIALGCFAFIGVIARESTHLFLGLPGSHAGDALTSPGAAAAEGLRFVGRTLVLAGLYCRYNFLAFGAAIVLAFAFLFYAVRRPKVVERAYVPVIIVPLLICAALAKVLWFDMPTYFLDDVLSRYTVDASTFDVPVLSSRVESVWNDVVCSRVAALGYEETKRICGTRTERAATQSGIARYLLDVIFTIAICGIGVAVLRKLMIPSAKPQWNLPSTWKWAIIGAVSTAVLAALFAVPWTYARTIASIELPYVCSGADCATEACPDKCYVLDDTMHWIGVPPALEQRGAEVGRKDVLTEAFRSQLGAPELGPLDHATHLPRRSPP